MSLTTAENGDMTLGKARHDVCVEVAYELEALAYALPKLTSNSDVEALNAGLAVRGIAGRYVALAEVLLAALSDDAETTQDLARRVHVAPTFLIDFRLAKAGLIPDSEKPATFTGLALAPNEDCT
jgi:hypothetical protein